MILILKPFQPDFHCRQGWTSRTSRLYSLRRNRPTGWSVRGRWSQEGRTTVWTLEATSGSTNPWTRCEAWNSLMDCQNLLKSILVSWIDIFYLLTVTVIYFHNKIKYILFNHFILLSFLVCSVVNFTSVRTDTSKIYCVKNSKVLKIFNSYLGSAKRRFLRLAGGCRKKGLKSWQKWEEIKAI